MRIEGVNVSSVMNRQINMIGDKRERVSMTLRRLGKGSGPRGHKLTTKQSNAVSKAAHVNGGFHALFAIPYDDEYSVVFYRSGSESLADHRLANTQGKFVKTQHDANVWALLLAKIGEDGNVQLPPHDNRPDGIGVDDEAEPAEA